MQSPSWDMARCKDCNRAVRSDGRKICHECERMRRARADDDGEDYRQRERRDSPQR